MRREPEDEAFDAVYPWAVQARSARHWTPVAVARRAAALLAPWPAMRVLDVGAGAGKLCLVGAAAAPQAAWTGIERDAGLVRVARAAAATLRLAGRVTFVVGDATQLAWTDFDAIYLYNPFLELLLGAGAPPADADAPVAARDDARRARYEAGIAGAQARLAALAPGTRVVTFHGLGGELPGSYACAHRELVGGGELCLWVQGASHPPAAGAR